MKISLRQVYLYIAAGSYLSFVTYCVINSFSNNMYSNEGFDIGNSFSKFAAVFVYCNLVAGLSVIIIMSNEILKLMKPILPVLRPITFLFKGTKKIVLWNPTVVTVGKKKEVIPTAKVHSGNL